MQTYTETKDPSETKDYTFDWSPKLASGEAITAQTVTFVDAAGTTSPSNTFASGISRVWLAGGTDGLKAIYTIRITTDGARTLEESFSVDIVDTVTGPTPQTEVERITAEIAEAKAMRTKVMKGEAVSEVWREGRRVVKPLPKLSDLNAMIVTLERELAEATAAAAGTSKRRPIGLAYRN